MVDHGAQSGGIIPSRADSNHCGCTKRLACDVCIVFHTKSESNFNGGRPLIRALRLNEYSALFANIAFLPLLVSIACCSTTAIPNNLPLSFDPHADVPMRYKILRPLSKSVLPRTHSLTQPRPHPTYHPLHAPPFSSTIPTKSRSTYPRAKMPLTRSDAPLVWIDCEVGVSFAVLSPSIILHSLQCCLVTNQLRELLWSVKQTGQACVLLCFISLRTLLSYVACFRTTALCSLDT